MEKPGRANDANEPRQAKQVKSYYASGLNPAALRRSYETRCPGAP